MSDYDYGYVAYEPDVDGAWWAEGVSGEAYPRADWSGDPETYYRSPFDMGGDLPPFHPWNRLPLEERARMWAEGHRPWMSDGSALSAPQSAFYVGWSQAPHPIDVVANFDPRATRKDQARAVLYDYYNDDPLRYWSDNEAVKRCFIGGHDPRKENHDPLLLIAAYENKNHKIWQCHGDKVTWKDLDHAVQQAIAHRKKLGPLPKSSYDTDPIVIYYYDNDKMKRISYPKESVPAALAPANTRWWDWTASSHTDPASKDQGLDAVHTWETSDPRKIQIERDNPGWKTKAELKKILAKYRSDFQKSDDCPNCTGKLDMNLEHGSAGGWGNEGLDWDRDVAGTGLVGSITGAVLAFVSAVLDATGFGAIIGVPLGIATPFIVAAINAADTALHAGDAGAALAGLSTALASATAQALTKEKSSIPPAAVKALGQTVAAISTAVRKGQEKKLDYGQLWSDVAKKAQSFGKLGDDEAGTIAHMISGQGPAAGHVFIQGYLAGKFLDINDIAAIAKNLQALANFYDARIINLGLLGMGIGHITKAQQGHVAPYVPPATATTGAFDSVGQIVTSDPHAGLAAYIESLRPRYAIHATSGAYDSVDDVHADARVEQAQRLLNDLRGCKPGDALFLEESGVLDMPTRLAVRNFQFEAGVLPCDGTPTEGTLHALETEMGHKRAVFLGFHMVGQTSLQPDYGPLSRGCPTGSWFDPFTNTCRATATPPPPQPQPMPLPGPAPQPMPLPGPAAPVPSVQGDFWAEAYPFASEGYYPWPWAV